VGLQETPDLCFVLGIGSPRRAKKILVLVEGLFPLIEEQQGISPVVGDLAIAEVELGRLSQAEMGTREEWACLEDKGGRE